MARLWKDLDSLTEADLQKLCEDGQDERKWIEFKAALPGRSDDERKEFFADVSSFANADGGHIVYGIREENSCAKEVCGLGQVDAGAEVDSLRNAIRDGMRPRLHGVECREIKLSSESWAIVIHIPKSWAGPHMVTFKNTSRFYSRTSNGKGQLDVDEIRNAFLGTSEIPRRLQALRAERIATVSLTKAELLKAGRPVIVLQVIPYSALLPGAAVDVLAPDATRNVLPFRQQGNRRINFDGVIVEDDDSYVQVWRSGEIGVVDVWPTEDLAGKTIPAGALEEEILQATGGYVRAQKTLGCSPPIALALSLLGFRGFRIRGGKAVDRDELLIPDVLMEDFDQSLGVVLRPVFDRIFNACGLPASPNYDQDGRWHWRR